MILNYLISTFELFCKLICPFTITTSVADNPSTTSINPASLVPAVNEINLAFPLNKTTLSTGEQFSFTNIIYKELLKLIIQKNLGGNIRKKTLRKRRKHPYIKKKTARRKNFYKKNLAKKA
jgi:hypothetical protein